MAEFNDDERTPLIPPTDTVQRRRFPQISTFTLLIPIAVANRFAGQLPVTTVIEIVQLAVCQLWYEIHEPGKLPDAEACTAGPVKERFAVVMTLMTVFEGLGRACFVFNLYLITLIIPFI